jgi:hypothetical protein
VKPIGTEARSSGPGFRPSVYDGVNSMNFKSMPEVARGFGYEYALGRMAFLGLALYYLFRRIDSLSSLHGDP